MIEGGCLCGKVRFEFNGEISEISMCHCSQCRKAQGSAFVPVSPINSSKITFEGREHIKEFQTTEKKVRAFCKNCGSPLYSARSDLPGVIRLRIGSVKTQFNCDKKYHIYVDSKATWYDITDNFPQYSEAAKDN